MAGTSRYDLLTNAAPGNGVAQFIQAGSYAFLVESSNFGGGNVKLQIQNPQGNFVDVTSSTLSANSMVILTLPAGQYRAVSTTALAVYAQLVTAPTITTR
jgi:hypothetical protein